MKLLLIILSSLAMVTVLSAGTIHVPGDYDNIQAGVDASIDGDTVLVADGTYSGDGNRYIDFAGRNIVLISENGPEDCVIDLAFWGHAFYFHTGETADAVVQGFTVTYGWDDYGGGVHIENSSPVFRNVIISSCTANNQGGGIYIDRAEPQFFNCVVHNCNASEGGGVSSSNSNIVLNSCIIAGNSSSG